MSFSIRTYRFLVEVWAEPREIAALPAILRARVRDMNADRGRYVGSFTEIEHIIDARLDAAGIFPRRWERTR